MTIAGLPAERLKTYLRELKPEVRAMLVAEVERGLERGQDIPGSDLILAELRSGIRGAGRSFTRPGDPGRLFFAPLDPFLVDQFFDRALPGRFERSSLTPLWNWISRDLAPERAQAFAEELAPFLAAGTEASAAPAVRRFQDDICAALRRKLDQIELDERERGRVAAQIGRPRAVPSVEALFRVLANRDQLAQIGARLPPQIRNLADEQLDNAVALLRHSIATRRELLQPALILIMRRLAAGWQLIRLAIRAAESDVAGKVAQSPLALAVDLVLAELRWNCGGLRARLVGGEVAQAAGAIKELHDTVRALRTEIDLSGDTPWSRELAAVRSEISDLLKGEIDGMPGRVRRLLRPYTAKEIRPGSELDPTEVKETEARLDLVAACRNFASELAINQVAPRIYSDLQNIVETANAPLIETLRAATADDRKFRQSQVDACVRFSAKLFGQEYAAGVARSAALAAQTRKAG
jgi:hypothetical protein